MGAGFCTDLVPFSQLSAQIQALIISREDKQAQISLKGNCKDDGPQLQQGTVSIQRQLLRPVVRRQGPPSPQMCLLSTGWCLIGLLGLQRLPYKERRTPWDFFVMGMGPLNNKSLLDAQHSVDERYLSIVWAIWESAILLMSTAIMFGALELDTLYIYLELSLISQLFFSSRHQMRLIVVL